MHPDSAALATQPMVQGRAGGVPGNTLPEQVESNGMALDALAEALTTLESRLSAVSCPQDVPDGQELRAIAQVQSPLGGSLRVQHTALQELIARVQALGARVEL
jgi:hypothetical protein